METVQSASAFGSQPGSVDHIDFSPCTYPQGRADDGIVPLNPVVIEQIRMEERCRIGRELHDSTSQLLVALQLRIAHQKSVLLDGTGVHMLEDLDQTLRELQREIRVVASLNQAPDFEARQLPGALRELGRRFSTLSGLSVTVAVNAQLTHDDLPAAFALYRITQEALANVHRHAAAKSVAIHLSDAGGQLHLTIRDDGIGIAQSRKHSQGGCGLGLENMRARAKALGGAATIRRVRPGTEINVTIPLVRIAQPASHVRYDTFSRRHHQAA